MLTRDLMLQWLGHQIFCICKRWFKRIWKPEGIPIVDARLPLPTGGFGTSEESLRCHGAIRQTRLRAGKPGHLQDERWGMRSLRQQKDSSRTDWLRSCQGIKTPSGHVYYVGRNEEPEELHSSEDDGRRERKMGLMFENPLQSLENRFAKSPHNSFVWSSIACLLAILVNSDDKYSHSKTFVENGIHSLPQRQFIVPTCLSPHVFWHIL